MVPVNIHDFLLASVGASASFIGLLFVALTLVLGRLPKGSSLATRERTLAGSAYTALITIFFISMVGLVPGASIAWAMVAIGWLGTGSSLQLARLNRRVPANRNRVMSSLTIVYVGLALFGLYSALIHKGTISPGVFFAILFVLYSVALTRAWTLVGVFESEKV